MKYELKDITTITAPGLIAHGVNCSNAMGSGVALALYTKWPEVKREYHKNGTMSLGDAQFLEVEPGLVVANCFTQEKYGRDGRRYANPWAIRESMKLVAKYAIHELEVNEVHIPMIGCGLGGLSWEEVEGELIEIEQTRPVTFVVCRV